MAKKLVPNKATELSFHVSEQQYFEQISWVNETLVSLLNDSEFLNESFE